MTPLNIAGISNGYKVDDALWRGAQPDEAAWPLLAAAACKHVIDLNNSGEAAEHQAQLVSAAGMDYVSDPWSGILPPSRKKIDDLLGLIDVYAGQGETVFIHCQHGSDRTGTLCACWRIHHDHQNFEDAIEEAFTSLGLQGMHEFWMAAAVAQYAHDQRGI